MNLKHISIGFAATTAAMTMATVPAEAARIANGSVLNLQNNINGGVEVTTPADQLSLDFFGARTPGTNPILVNQGLRNGPGANTGDFSNTNISPIARISDLLLSSTAPTQFQQGALANFLTGIDALGNSNFRFNLARFVYDSSTGAGRFIGTFTDGISTTSGIGTFTLGNAITSPETGPNDFRYSLSVTAVPTPALLPGLIGLGAAALRKRKSEQAEAVKA